MSLLHTTHILQRVNTIVLK